METENKCNLNELKQEQEEQWAILPLLYKFGDKLSSVEHIGTHMKPDFKFIYNNLKIGLEIVTLRPYKNRNFNTPHATEEYVRSKIYSYFKTRNIDRNKQIYIALGEELLYSSGKLKNNNNINEAIASAIDGKSQYNYFQEFRVVDLVKGLVVNSDDYVNILQLIKECYGEDLPNITFVNPGGFQIPIDINDVKEALELKETKYDHYKFQEKFDDVWLCINMPREEYGFTIKGALIPEIKSKYGKIWHKPRIRCMRICVNVDEVLNLQHENFGSILDVPPFGS